MLGSTVLENPAALPSEAVVAFSSGQQAPQSDNTLAAVRSDMLLDSGKMFAFLGSHERSAFVVQTGERLVMLFG